MTVEDLARQHAEQQARTAELGARLEQQRGEATAARQARLNEYDQAAVAGYAATEEAIEDEEKQAYSAFKAALLDTPFMVEWIKFRAARWRRTYLRSEIGAAMRRVGDTSRPPTPLEYRDPRLIEDILQIGEDEARAVAADEADARAAAREAAGEGETP